MPTYRNAFETDQTILKRSEDDRQSLMRRELETYLVEGCGKVLEENSAWELDQGSASDFEASCESHRERWRRTVGEFQFNAPLVPFYEPCFEDDGSIGQWLSLDLDDGLSARAILAFPKGREEKLPLIVAQHGISSSPERVFGINDTEGLYHACARALLDAGYAVLAPSNITGADPRARLQRLCLLQGKTLAGLEVGKIRRLIDFAATLPQIDSARIGMWGLSLGAMYTMFTAPLDKRIKAAIISAFFNDRLAKMAISSRLYSCFLDVAEEHIWIPGWFAGGFDDSKLLALICPRALQVQQGRADGIGWWPLQHEAFKKAKGYYDELGLSDRIEYADHQGGHEILVDEGLAFLHKHL